MPFLYLDLKDILLQVIYNTAITDVSNNGEINKESRIFTMLLYGYSIFLFAYIL